MTTPFLPEPDQLGSALGSQGGSPVTWISNILMLDAVAPGTGV
ncbi:hypothetical protein [Deinococcus arenicola]|uniref:Uncharacterized protein n=1 Tax=Deinococcus arenicola TaxID=2994950 RepID=A0ABU4DTH7_9DEIO|nr:hypothetical protein [Deinococcus sp. ZS9-10]MDV6375730.1 hypothetical protein [Deinococcus sp. ZS9-10]